jgi:two-component system secretion response regulator SsrB
MSIVRVVIADDEPDVLFLLGIQLQGVDGIDVVGTAANGRDAVDRCRELQPDAVVMDLLMPVKNGFQAIEELRDAMPDLHIIAYTAVAGEYVRAETERLGVDLVLKSGDIDVLATALTNGKGPAGTP